MLTNQLNAYFTMSQLSALRLTFPDTTDTPTTLTQSRLCKTDILRTTNGGDTNVYLAVSS